MGIRVRGDSVWGIREWWLAEKPLQYIVMMNISSVLCGNGERGDEDGESGVYLELEHAYERDIAETVLPVGVCAVLEEDARDVRTRIDHGRTMGRRIANNIRNVERCAVLKEVQYLRVSMWSDLGFGSKRCAPKRASAAYSYLRPVSGPARSRALPDSIRCKGM